jgi:2-polyprenyl-6-methoxyphenol hydroxylase-like FAD-dependent oxidoreductase
MSTTAVLIIGAGPTGLTLACSLARSGIAFTIIEQAAGPSPGSRGKSLQPRSLEVLDDLGAVGKVLAHGEAARPILFTDIQGTETYRTGAPPPPTPTTPYPSSVVAAEWRTEEALRARLTELGGQVSFGVQLRSFKQEQDTAVTATLVDVDSGEEKTITASWLVACDGGHSIVRKNSDIHFLGETLEEVRMIVADVVAEGVDRDIWRIWQGGEGEGFIALCPLASTEEWQLQIQLAPGQEAELSLANMQTALSRHSKIVLKSASWSSLWRANVRMVDQYRAGRVFLAGDAAHIHSPAGGQGMNTGIQDAYNLGWKLAAVIRGAGPALLDTYEEERLPIAAGVLSLSDKLMRETLASKGAALFGRDWKTKQLDLGYRGSSLARDDRPDDDHKIEAGDRVPDATGLVDAAGEHSLFDLLRGEHFTLLSFGEGAVNADDLRAKYPWLRLKTVRLGSEVQDTGGHVQDVYGLPEGIALIRPDGYLGLVAREDCQAALERYLADLA